MNRLSIFHQPTCIHWVLASYPLTTVTTRSKQGIKASIFRFSDFLFLIIRLLYSTIAFRAVYFKSPDMCCRRIWFRFFCLSQTADQTRDKTDKTLIPINRFHSSLSYNKSLFYTFLCAIDAGPGYEYYKLLNSIYISTDRAGVCFHICHNSKIIRTCQDRYTASVLLY